MSGNNGGKPQSEHRHLKWFNALSAAEQKEWCVRANSARAIDAWRAWKSVRALSAAAVTPDRNEL